MSSPVDNGFDSMLLDLHLGRLSAEERQALERRIAGDPALSAQNEALAAMFEALNGLRDSTPPPAADLEQRVTARVAAAGPPLRVKGPPERRTVDLAEEYENAGVIRLHSFREIIAVAALIVLAVGIGVPSMLHMRERGRRIVCSENLASIGRGMQAYAFANHNALPFAGWTDNNSWRPSDDPTITVLPNRRHIYRLLLQRHVPARFFVCPSANDVPMPEDQVPLRNDFLESRNLSYAYQNMAGVRPSLRDNPDLPVLGDDNPLFDDGWPLLAATRGLGLGDPAKINSRAHGGAGQNILTLSGVVKWRSTPLEGIDGDNIWTLNNVEDYTGREGPQTSSDSHLLK